MKKTNLLASLIAASALLFSAFSFAADETQQDANGVILSGYDTVAYFTMNKAVEGDAAISAVHDGAIYRFSSEENRDAFKADPKKYIPEFGGWCPVALSHGELKVGRTNQFTRVDEKLYLNFDKSAQRQFSNNPEPYIFKAKASW